MGDAEHTREEALKQELEATREYLFKLQEKLNQQGKEKEFFSSLDDKVQGLPCLLKRTRIDEILLVKPFIRQKTAIEDIQDCLYIIQELEAKEREFDWTRHYFFEPLQMTNQIRGTRRAPAYFLFKKIANEFNASPRKLSLVQIEALLFRMTCLPNDYCNALKAMDQNKLALSQVWPDLKIDDACRMYAESLLNRLDQYNRLSKDERNLLVLRAVYCNDNREAFLKKLSDSTISGLVRLR
ncbi:MAG: hypothetical protein QXM31_04130, partial [Candidatus Woesearchaeota archaeon]